MKPTRALAYARSHRPRFLAELKEFLRFRSVSSQPERARDVARCAQWLAVHLRHIGLDRVQVVPASGSDRSNPIVYGEWQHAPGRPTLLIYGHYDVLPGEPTEKWNTPPFTPVVIGNDLFARGSSDDKGPLFCHIKACESFLATERALPVNIKCIFEGEEEVGSPHLPSFIARNRELLRADVAVISDTRMAGPDKPAIIYAQRGGLRAELEVRGPADELHSGNFGGAVHNPIQCLSEMLSSLHDNNGRVTIPGFYDDVFRWSDKERVFMVWSGPSDNDIRRAARIEHAWGESGYTLYERTTIRPALTLNSIVGGHTGSGHKAIIPATARAKLSFRLVPDQDPETIERLFRNHIAAIAPPTVRVSVRTLSPVKPALMDRNHPSMRTAALAYKKGFGAFPAFLRSGGSIPVVNTLQQKLGIPTVLMGFGLPDDHIHAPNEKFNLPTFSRAIETCIWHLAIAAVTAQTASRRLSRNRRQLEWSR